MPARLLSGLVFLCLLLPTIASGQTRRSGPPKGPLGGPTLPPNPWHLTETPDGKRRSHLPLDSGLEKNLRPQIALEERLREFDQLKALQDSLGDPKTRAELQSLARKLMQDEQLLESLKGKFSRQDVESLLGKVGQGQGVTADPNLRKLLGEILDQGKISPQDKNLLKNLGEKIGEKIAPRRSSSLPLENTKGAQPADPAAREQNPPAETPEPAPPPSRRIQTQGSPASQTPPSPRSASPDWFQQNLDRWMQNMESWARSPQGASWKDFLRDLSQQLQVQRSAAPDLVRRARGISRYLPRVSNLFPRNVSTPFSTPRFHSLPRLGMPTAPSPGSLAAGGKVLVALLILAAVGVGIWRAGGWYEQAQSKHQTEWRLGPWPVRPERVASREDLVRAFEHLALVCLGKPAQTQHHLELARNMGAQPALDIQRRRQAVETLARFYEQARYQPLDDPFTETELEQARRELCYLAEVSAA